VAAVPSGLSLTPLRIIEKNLLLWVEHQGAWQGDHCESRVGFLRARKEEASMRRGNILEERWT
jgi:hypothetical protein